MRQHLTACQNNCATHFKFKAVINIDYTIYKKIAILKAEFSRHNK